jgi:hypothetical protein
MDDEKWEYCCLTRMGGMTANDRGEKAVVAYWGTTTSEQEIAPSQVGRAVGLLGQDGWEMVSATTENSASSSARLACYAYYFKRRAGKPISNPFLTL